MQVKTQANKVGQPRCRWGRAQLQVTLTEQKELRTVGVVLDAVLAPVTSKNAAAALLKALGRAPAVEGRPHNGREDPWGDQRRDRGHVTHESLGAVPRQTCQRPAVKTASNVGCDTVSGTYAEKSRPPLPA